MDVFPWVLSETGSPKVRSRVLWNLVESIDKIYNPDVHSFFEVYGSSEG